MIVEGSDYGGTSVGNAFSGKLFEAYGFIGVFSTSAGILIVAVLFCVVIIKETRGASNDGGSKQNEDNSNQDEAKNCMSITRQSVLYILEGFRTVVTPREGWRRALVLLGVFQYICYICVYNGTEGSHRFYFLENKYKWSEKEINTILFILRTTSWLGLWLVVPLLTKIVKISESSVAIIAVLTSALGSFLRC